MFTGIIEEIGKVKTIQKGRQESFLTIEANKIFDDLKLGDSVAVNGVCLTVRSQKAGEFTADVMNETWKKSSLNQLTAGSGVNLERAMAANGRFGGHMVSGHIDGEGQIDQIWKDDNAIWIQIKTDQNVMRYIVKKGSIAIDGVSLTVAEVEEERFRVSIIPHTADQTILLSKKAGERVNLENDMVGKYIEKFANTNSSQKSKGITLDLLTQTGFL